jgi:hypothetical protein
MSAQLQSEDAVTKAMRLNNWTIFDLNLCSNDPKVDQAVETVFHHIAAFGPLPQRPNVHKKNLKAILINLVNAWQTDPESYIGFHRGMPYYANLPSRYNRNGIKYSVVKVIDALIKTGAVEHEKGHFYRTGGQSHISRMRMTTQFADHLSANFGIFRSMIRRAPDTECIIMRDIDPNTKRKKLISYSDTPDTIRMRRELTAYNNLLAQCFIEIPFRPPNGIPTKSGNRILIDPDDKFVRRIFNNGSWDDGGRFYGGWWQRIPSEWRARITIHGFPVVEIDYSGLHIILLYAAEGIDYWTEIGSDPYSLPSYISTHQIRRLLKLVLLTALNAKDKVIAIQAVRREINSDPAEWGFVKRDHIYIDKIVDEFVMKHSPIAKYFFTGSGIKLQRIDSLIAENVINEFVSGSNVVLSVHDSFIAPSFDEWTLREAMNSAFDKVVRASSPRLAMVPKIKTLGLTEEMFVRYKTPYLDHHEESQPPTPSIAKLLKNPHADQDFTQRFGEHYFNGGWQRNHYTCD